MAFSRIAQAFNTPRSWLGTGAAVAAMSLFWPAAALPAVTMMGTRVVYPGDARERMLQFTNEGKAPNIVQVWIDEGDPQATLETARSPFVVTPQVFLVEPQAGQVARVVVADAASLPSDRESVFYLNFSQVPALKKSDQDRNRLVLLVNSRLKLFYRPAGLPGSSAAIGDQLQVNWSDKGITVHNPTAYHAVVLNAELLSNGKGRPVPNVDMIAPKSSATWPMEQGAQPRTGPRTLRLGIINDFGATVYSDHSLP